MSEKKKDYLSMLADEVEEKKKKPASFSEEKFERIEKPKMNLNPKLIGAVCAVLIVLGIGAYFLFFAPKIEMPDFVGQKTTDVTAWVKQQGIATSGIIIKEEYSFDVEEDVIISQSIDAGKKVKEDAKITFVASIGADPDEKVDFPSDVLAMTRDDVQEWIDDNKLTSVRISQSYSDSVEEGYVISYDLRGLDASDFTRSSNVTFTVSRGPQPASIVTLEDFDGKSQYEVESWAKSKKIELEIYESYSDEDAAGTVISQSIAAGKTMKEGETLIITISKGKAVTLPDFTVMSKADFNEWVSENPNILKTKEQYSEQGGYVLSQSVKAGVKIGSEDDKVEVVINIGRPKLDKDYIGASYQSLVDWCNAERSKGADMYAGQWGSQEATYSYQYKAGTITSIQCSSYSSGEIVACSGSLPLDARFDVVLSKGLVVNVKDTKLAVSVQTMEDDPTTEDVDEAQYTKAYTEDTTIIADALTAAGMRYTIEASYSDTAQIYDKTDGRVLNDVENDKLYEDHEYIIQKK